MNPHLFVWSGGVINLDKVISAQIHHGTIRGSSAGEQPFVYVEIELDHEGLVRIEGETVGRFMLQCARYHENFQFYENALDPQPSPWPWADGPKETKS